MNQTANRITSGALGGAFAAILVWGIGIGAPGVEVTNEVAISFSVICTFFVQVAWRKFLPESK